jgi:predicted transcriptional regulator
MPVGLLNVVTEIVKSRTSNADMTPDDMNDAIRKVYRALKWVQTQEEKSTRAPEKSAIPGPESIQRNKVICLECGKEFKQLTGRHLAFHGLDPKEYRQKYGIPLRQSLSARSLSAKRRRITKERGLGEGLAKARRGRR